MPHLRRSIVPLGVGLLGMFVALVPLAMRLEEDPGLLWLFRLRGVLPAPEEVVVVGISADSAAALGVSAELDEWPRALHGVLLDRLRAAGAALVLMDITFEEPRDPANDRPFADAMHRAGNVVLLERVRSTELEPGAIVESRIAPIGMLEEAALATAPFVLPRVPIRTSQFWTFGRVDASMPNLPVVALHSLASVRGLAFDELLTEVLAADGESTIELYGRSVSDRSKAIREIFQAQPEVVEALVDVVDQRTLDESDERLLRALIDAHAGPASRYINYYGPARTVRTLPYQHILEDTAGLDLAGKVVFVGYSESRQPEQQDDFLSVFSERTGINLSGVEVGATAFANLLDGNSIRPLGLGQHLLVVFVWGGLLSLFLLCLPAVAIVPGVLAAGAAYLGLAWWQFGSNELWLPLVVPLFVQLPAAAGWVAYWHYRQLSEQRTRIQKVLGYYVPPRMVSRLASESSAEPARQVVRGTCLVTDAVQFTRLSEALAPDELGELMEAYFRVISEVVERHGGFVADISGDSMVAIWTTGLTDVELKRAALTAAAELLHAVDDFNAAHSDRALPTGVGLDSGELLFGNIGLAQHYQYRAMGDIVNTAARIEGLNRVLGTRGLVSAATCSLLPGLHGRRLGSFLLRGKTIPSTVYELGAAEPRNDSLFAAGLAAFEQGDWEGAEQAFRDLLAEDSADGPARYYLEQTRWHAELRLPEDWSGTIEISTK